MHATVRCDVRAHLDPFALQPLGKLYSIRAPLEGAIHEPLELLSRRLFARAHRAVYFLIGQ